MPLPFLNEFRTESRIWLFLYVKDFFILVFFGIIGFTLKSMVHSRLGTAFTIFNIGVGILFIIKPKSNPGKRLYETIFIMLSRDNKIYKPVIGKKKVLGKADDQSAS